MSKESQRRPVMLLVLGPHRCGTSVTARMLECLGASNSRKLLAADDHNPTGYFEDRDVYLLNEFGLLRQLGRRWDSVRPVDWSSPGSRDILAHRAAAAELLRRNYRAPGSLFVLKEPRMATLLPFWLPVLEEAGFEARAVCIVRHPLAMARSLQRRNGLPLAHGSMLYLAQWLAILPQLRELPSAFVTFEEVVQEPADTLRNIAGKLALPLPAGFSGNVEVFARAHVQPRPQADGDTCGEPREASGIPRAAFDLHHHLLSVARGGVADTQAALAAASTAVDLLAPMLETFDRLHEEALEHRKTRHAMEQAHRELVRRHGKLARELSAEEPTKDASAGGNRAGGAMQTALDLRDAKIREFEASTSWRITAPLRRLTGIRRSIRSILDCCSLSLRVLLEHRKTGLFDPRWYARVHRLSGLAHRHSFIHFAVAGLHRGNSPNALFDPAYYAAANPDVAAAGVPPLRHYLLCGFREGRDYSPFFDREFYLSQNPELADGLTDLPGHYLRVGWQQGKNPHPFFRPDEVLGRNPSLRSEGVSPLEYYLHGDWKEDPCPEFSFAMTLETPGPDSARNPRRFLRLEAQADCTPVILEEEALLETPAAPPDVTAIAIYLPQFHAIPENDAWWGKGFTEWTNVRRGKPHYAGHYQPHVPHRDTGYYDLNDPEILERQARTARAAGIGGFCFYYYWFAGKRLLEMPTDRMLSTGRPDFPFCFCWANENWSRRWDGGDDEILIAQNHSPESDEQFIRELLPAFRDPRHIRVDGRPLLAVYRPARLPAAAATAKMWRAICHEEGIGDIFLALMESPGAPEPAAIGFDAAIQFPPIGANVPQVVAGLGLAEPARFRGMVFDYRGMAASYAFRPLADDVFPGVCPSWDNTARTMERAHSWVNASPGNYHQWLSKAARNLRERRPRSRRILFINAWNEWAEGNHLEADERHGHAWLDATRRALCGDNLQSGAEPEDQTEALHPAVFRHRWERVLAIFGDGISPENHRFLVHHLPLLSTLLQQGCPLAADRGTPSVRHKGERLRLDTPGALRALRQDLTGATPVFCFVVLQFNQHEQTVRCVESLRRLEERGLSIRIVVVDNDSRPEVAALGEETWRDSPDITLLRREANGGYAQGNNLGYAFARESLGAQFVAILNNDTVVTEAGFAATCVELFHEHGFSLLGPDIVNRDGSRENPWNNQVYDPDGWDELQSLYRREQGTWRASGHAVFPQPTRRSPGLPLLRNGILQGAAIVASPLFVGENRRIFDERTFLYGEEFLLSTACLLRGHTMLYSRHVRIRHEHGASTAVLPGASKWSLGYDNAILAAGLSRDRLARHDAATAGQPVSPHAPELPGLLADGGRHTLIDLLFCQPGFHGGGEYGKAVFKACAESAARHGDVQLWIAMDPTLGIEDWVWPLCRRFAINVIAVRSFAEITALVNSDRFASFFAPAIAVYTGYAYQAKVGGSLPFTCRRTKIFGTLLDLRDFEMARDWRPIADARRRVGCTAESGKNAAALEEEGRQQALHAADLREMYRRICTHRSITKIFTISQYCAESVRTHVVMPEGKLEVFPAPQKSRAQPIPLLHPGIDFARTPFALMLNAARIEKNAASVVAAFDTLFASGEFAEAHPDLRVVLTGLASLDELGMPRPKQAARFIALPQLDPGHLEFLLQQARMLLYPSFNEGFGYPPLEAMTHGTPSVVARTSSLPEVCGPAAVYCDPCDLGSIAAAIQKLLRDGVAEELMAGQLAAINDLRAANSQRMVDLILCRDEVTSPPPGGRGGSSAPDAKCAPPQWRGTEPLPITNLHALVSHRAREASSLLIKGARAQRSLQPLAGATPASKVLMGDLDFPNLPAVRVRDVTVKGADVVFMDGKPAFWHGVHPPYAQRMFPGEDAGVTGRDAESIVRISSPVAHLGHWTSHIYGHFLLEMLPKVVGFLELKAIYPDLKLLVSNWAGERSMSILRILIRGEDLCIYDAKTQRVEAGELLLLPSLFHDRVVHPAMDHFRTLAHSQAVPPRTSPPRIFVSKSRWRLTHSQDFRFLANEAEIRSFLEQRGFLTVFPEELPWPEQVSLFAGARVIVGEYTSALHNALFSPAGSVVIGLNRINQVQDSIASYAGHRIGYVLPSDGRPRIPGVRDLEPGYHISVDNLDRLLQASG